MISTFSLAPTFVQNAMQSICRLEMWFALSSLGAGGKTRLKSSMKKFKTPV